MQKYKKNQFLQNFLAFFSSEQEKREQRAKSFYLRPLRPKDHMTLSFRLIVLKSYRLKEIFLLFAL